MYSACGLGDSLVRNIPTGTVVGPHGMAQLNVGNFGNRLNESSSFGLAQRVARAPLQ